MNRWCFTYGIRIFIGCALIALLSGVAVMLLWNWLIPLIFNGPSISFLQALGLLALVRVLTGFKGWSPCGCDHGWRNHHPKEAWKKRWEERLANLSPEEREKVREKYKKCCGPWESKEERQQG